MTLELRDYKGEEDFTEFKTILAEMTDYIIQEKGEEVISDRHQKDFQKEGNSVSNKESNSSENFTDVSFEDI